MSIRSKRKVAVRKPQKRTIVVGTTRPQKAVKFQERIVVAQATRARKKRTRSRKSGNTRNAIMGGDNRGVAHPIDEQVAIVNGSVAFAQTTFAINPGNSTMFPLLSRIAQNYERYEFVQLEFYYRPNQSVFGAQGVQGFVDISSTNDAAQAPPSTQQMAEIFHHTISGPVETAKTCRLHLSKSYLESSSKQKHFVRPNGQIPGGSDPHLYDCGQIFFWTSGQPAATAIGELRVRGRVVLMNQVLESSTIPHANFSVAQLVQTVNQPLVTSVQSVALLGNTTINNGYTNNISVVNTAGQIVPPVGNYLVSGSVNFNSTGLSTVFQTELSFHGLNFLANDVLPSGAYASWNMVIPPTYIACDGINALTLSALSTFSTGATSFLGQLTIEAV